MSCQRCRICMFWRPVSNSKLRLCCTLYTTFVRVSPCPTPPEEKPNVETCVRPHVAPTSLIICLQAEQKGLVCKSNQGEVNPDVCRLLSPLLQERMSCSDRCGCLCMRYTPARVCHAPLLRYYQSNSSLILKASAAHFCFHLAVGIKGEQ